MTLKKNFTTNQHEPTRKKKKVSKIGLQYILAVKRNDIEKYI